jgi:hypothetical protein
VAEYIETFGGTWVCPMDDCPFLFEFRYCMSEDEGRALIMQITRLHGRFQHGSEGTFEARIYTVTSMREAGRRPLDN